MFLLLAHWYHFAYNVPFFQFRSTSSRKDDLTEVDMVRSRETRNTIRLTSWRNARKIQRIHDRFIRDPEFSNRMIENNRDEESCRKWDALEDENHSHYLTPQEYSLYKSNWRLHSNKKDSNTVRTTHRSDSIRNYQPAQLRKKGPYKRPRSLTEINNGAHGGIGKIHCGLLIPMKVTMEMDGSTDKTGPPVVQYLEQFFWARLSWIQLLRQKWIVYCWRRSTIIDEGRA